MLRTRQDLTLSYTFRPKLEGKKSAILRKLEEMATPKPFIDVMIDQTPNLAKKFWSKAVHEGLE